MEEEEEEIHQSSTVGGVRRGRDPTRRSTGCRSTLQAEDYGGLGGLVRSAGERGLSDLLAGRQWWGSACAAGSSLPLYWLATALSLLAALASPAAVGTRPKRNRVALKLTADTLTRPRGSPSALSPPPPPPGEQRLDPISRLHPHTQFITTSYNHCVSLCMCVCISSGKQPPSLLYHRNKTAGAGLSELPTTVRVLLAYDRGLCLITETASHNQETIKYNL